MAQGGKRKRKRKRGRQLGILRDIDDAWRTDVSSRMAELGIGIKELARRMGASTGTVSEALNPTKGKTRWRWVDACERALLEAAAELQRAAEGVAEAAETETRRPRTRALVRVPRRAEPRDGALTIDEMRALAHSVIDTMSADEIVAALRDIARRRPPR